MNMNRINMSVNHTLTLNHTLTQIKGKADTKLSIYQWIDTLPLFIYLGSTSPQLS
jgi:hypothetical protein